MFIFDLKNLKKTLKKISSRIYPNINNCCKNTYYSLMFPLNESIICANNALFSPKYCKNCFTTQSFVLLTFVQKQTLTTLTSNVIEIFYQTDLGPKPYDCLWPRLFPLPRPGLMFVTSANCSKRLRCCRNSGSSLRFILTGASGILSFQHPAKKESSLKYSLRVLRKKSGYFARLSSQFIEDSLKQSKTGK